MLAASGAARVSSVVSPMTTRRLICLLPLVLAGCFSTRSDDGFASLHQRVEHMLAGRCTNGPVTNDENLGRFFEVAPRDSGCRILVFERDFLTQQEWHRKYAYVTEQTT